MARPDSTPGTVQDGLSDERHFWEEMFWDCRVDAQPDRPDLGWLVDDSVTLTPRDAPGSETLPAHVLGRSRIEWSPLIELVLSVVGILVAALLVLWLWGP